MGNINISRNDDLIGTGSKVINGKKKIYQQTFKFDIGEILCIAWRLQNKTFLLETRYLDEGGTGHCRYYEMQYGFSQPEIMEVLKDTVHQFRQVAADLIEKQMDLTFNVRNGVNN